MATTKNTKQQQLEERGLKALESIADSLNGISDWIYDLDTDLWSERLEWYLNEFYQIAKAKTVGSTNRPPRDAERTSEQTDSTDE